MRAWPEEVRLDFVLQLADDPWLSEKIEQFALSDPSVKVKWNVARRLSWFGYTEKVEKLLSPLNDADFREVVRALDPDEIPKSQWPRVVAAYEQMYNEARDPFERLRLLHVLQTFGGTNIAERMKTELDGLEPDQLKPGETQGKIRWALDELQKSDPKWVSEWAARKVLDKSIWFAAWEGLITQISNEEREALYYRFAAELLDQGEQRRVVSVLVSVMDSAFAARVFARACEIRAELTPPPGHDPAKWDHFRQVEDLLRAISPAKILVGISDKLEKEPVPVELDILTDILPSSNLTKPDVRSSVTEDMRAKLRAYLKRAARIGAEPDGLRASTRAHLAQLLANVAEREDMEDIRRLVAADSVRFERVQAARMKGDRSQDPTGYGFLYLEAVTTVDPAEADDVVVDLIGDGRYVIGPKPCDPNRNFPRPGESYDYARARGLISATHRELIDCYDQPLLDDGTADRMIAENRILIQLIEREKPVRAASLHGHNLTVVRGDAPGIFVDPRGGFIEIGQDESFTPEGNDDDRLAKVMLDFALTKYKSIPPPLKDATGRRMTKPEEHPFAGNLIDFKGSRVIENSRITCGSPIQSVPRFASHPQPHRQSLPHTQANFVGPSPVPSPRRWMRTRSSAGRAPALQTGSKLN